MINVTSNAKSYWKLEQATLKGEEGGGGGEVGNVGIVEPTGIES